MRVLYRQMDRTLFTSDFPPPAPPLEIGDRLMFQEAGHTLGGEMFARGETIEVVGRTDEAPYHRITTEGNLLIRGKGRVSVWGNIEWLLADRHLVRAPRDVEG